jgi:hypothetical protein
MFIYHSYDPIRNCETIKPPKIGGSTVASFMAVELAEPLVGAAMVHQLQEQQQFQDAV